MNLSPNTFICADSMDVMRDLPNGYANLCLTDPPYGINAADGKNETRGKLAKPTKFTRYEWDSSPPSGKCISELIRTATNQIIWGGNYFAEHLNSSPCWLVWNKDNFGDFADCELAYTSFLSAVRMFTWRWAGMLQQDMGKRKEIRYHPTQKPVALFIWCLLNYSKPGDLIIDPFCGSGTTALACHKTGRRFICIDREQEYIDIAKHRYAEAVAQTELFAPSEIIAEQTTITI